MLAHDPLVARKGRASYLGERSAGHQDPGATSPRISSSRPPPTHWSRGIGDDTANPSKEEGMPKYVGALDQGTTSTRFMIFDHAGRVVAIHQKEHEQIFPKPGWVEHDPAEIWARSQEVIRARSRRRASPPPISPPSGITNQRETAVVWDKTTGKAVYNAIVWQDTRTDVIVNEFAKDGGQDRFRAQGRPAARDLLLGPQGQVDPGQRRRRARQGRGRRPAVRQHRHLVHLEPDRRHQRRRPRHRRDQRQPHDADEPRDPRLGRRDPRHAWASRSRCCPTIKASSEVYGTGVGDLAGIPIAGDLGDQQAALFGQTCFAAGEAKNTYGTGCFMLLNTGTKAGAVEERPAHDARLQDRRPARGVRARGLDRDHRRARPVAARQPRA